MRPASEEAFLELIDRFFPREGSNLLLGRGDDCAVLACSGHICLTSDLFLEGIHFRRPAFSAADIGYKSLAVNLSDIAAMGAQPLGFSLNLMVPPGLEEAFWPEFFQSMSRLAGELGAVLAGGDLSRAPSLGVGVTMWGRAEERYLQRVAGAPGDHLFLVGEVGLSRAGLFILEHGGDPAAYPGALRAHRRPPLHCREALELGRLSGVKGLMDVSDGLARDLPRFLGPGPGAEISLDPQGIPDEVRRYCQDIGAEAETFAYLGGEDYALLGCVAEAGWAEVERAVPQARRIGYISEAQGIRLSGKRADLGGFDHFGPG